MIFKDDLYQIYQLKMEDEILRRFYISRTNMIKTLIYRGYTISNCEMTFEEFVKTHRNKDVSDMKKSMSKGMIFKDSKLPSIIVLWISERKLGANVRDVVDVLEKKNASHALVVADEGVTPQAKETLRLLRTTKKIFIDVWTIRESMIFTPDHVLVPPHRICSVQEKKKIYTCYGLQSKEVKIPKIRHDDVMIKYLGASKGQLIEIIRPSETNATKKIISYRVVS